MKANSSEQTHLVTAPHEEKYDESKLALANGRARQLRRGETQRGRSQVRHGDTNYVHDDEAYEIDKGLFKRAQLPIRDQHLLYARAE